MEQSAFDDNDNDIVDDGLNQLHHVSGSTTNQTQSSEQLRDFNDLDIFFEEEKL